MTLPTTDFANCELSLEELEAIAAGGFWSTLKHIGEDVGKVLIGVAAIGTAVTMGALLVVGIGSAANTYNAYGHLNAN